MHQFIYGLLIGIFAGGALSYLYAKTVIAKAQADSVHPYPLSVVLFLESPLSYEIIAHAFYQEKS